MEEKPSPIETVFDKKRNSQQTEEKSAVGSTSPLLFVDVNIGPDKSERIVVMEGDSAEGLALKFCEEHGFDKETEEKLTLLLQNQIANILTKIDEEVLSDRTANTNLSLAAEDQIES